MRIIGGEHGGRRIAAPKGTATRPTSERVREALFSILRSPPDQAEILDLFAGTGCLGLEAISRGAAHAVFVDSSRSVARVLRQNVATLGVGDRTSIICATVADALARPPISRRPAERAFTWIFIDPPYATELGVESLELLGGDHSALVADDTVVILEHDRRRESPLEAGCLVRTDRRRYGDTELSFYQRRKRPVQA